MPVKKAPSHSLLDHFFHVNIFLFFVVHKDTFYYNLLEDARNYLALKLQCKKSDKFSLFKDHWTDLSNIYHDNGPAMLENTKLEIKKNNKIILETYLGKDDTVNSKINFKEHQIKINKSYYFLGYQHDKGTFYKIRHMYKFNWNFI